MTRDQLLADLRRALEPHIADEVEAWIPTDDDRPYGIARSNTGDLLTTVRESVTRAFPDRAERILAQLEQRAGFYLSLAETIQWCSLVVDERRLGASLRTRALWSPPDPTVADFVLTMPHAERARVVSVLLERRRSRLKHYPLVRGSRGGGRLLVWCPDETTMDGASPAESNGYFDDHDAPPWDTWISIADSEHSDFRSSLVIAWAPPIAVQAADAGIQVNADGAIRFLGDLSGDLAVVPTGIWNLDP